MRAFVYLVSFLSVSLAAAAPTNSLVVPVYVVDQTKANEPTPVAETNQALRERSRPELPSNFIVIGDDVTDSNTLAKLREAIRAAGTNLSYKDGDLQLAHEAFPNDHFDDKLDTPRTCYTGEPAVVRYLAAALAGDYYAPDMEVIAVRYGDNTWVKSQDVNRVVQEMREWRDFNKTAPHVLLISQLGSAAPVASLIQRCN